MERIWNKTRLGDNTILRSKSSKTGFPNGYDLLKKKTFAAHIDFLSPYICCNMCDGYDGDFSKLWQNLISANCSSNAISVFDECERLHLIDTHRLGNTCIADVLPPLSHIPLLHGKIVYPLLQTELNISNILIFQDSQ